MRKLWLRMTEWGSANKGILIVMAAIIFLDRLTKVWTLNVLVEKPVEVLPFFHLTYVENTGAAFGMFKDGNLLLIGVMLLIVFYLIKNWKELTAMGPCVKWGISFILAGAFGNLYDRITLGFVVDFLDFRVWPVFNVADSFITVGGVLLALSLFTGKKTVEEK